MNLEDDAPTIFEFRGPNYFLSNFYECSFVWEGIVWKSSEAAYQAAKTDETDLRLLFSELPPGRAKKLGRKIQLPDDWDTRKIEVMASILREKFSQNPHLAAALLATGHRILEEGNTWNDTFWGVCPPKTGKGSNFLGRVLMRVRYELQSGLLKVSQ
jgi:ribA/ribD-fused uncharacterized protein